MAPQALHDLIEMLNRAHAALDAADTLMAKYIEGILPVEAWRDWKRLHRQALCDEVNELAALLAPRPEQEKEEREEVLIELIRWALGESETEEFPTLPDDWPRRKFYWREPLRARLNAILDAAAAPRPGAEQADEQLPSPPAAPEEEKR